MRKGHGLLFFANLFLAAILLYYIGTRGISPPPAGWEYKDLISIILTALAALLAALAILIGVLAIWGYNSIREAAVKAAETKAEEVAKRIAEPVATRAAEAAVRATAPEDRTDDLAKALSEGDGQ